MALKADVKAGFAISDLFWLGPVCCKTTCGVVCLVASGQGGFLLFTSSRGRAVSSPHRQEKPKSVDRVAVGETVVFLKQDLHGPPCGTSERRDLQLSHEDACVSYSSGNEVSSPFSG